jgi:hypothetical protein
MVLGFGLRNETEFPLVPFPLEEVQFSIQPLIPLKKIKITMKIKSGTEISLHNIKYWRGPSLLRNGC